MNKPHDPNVTADIPSALADPLDAGLAAGFARPPRSSLGELRPVLLKEAEGESELVVKPKSDAMPTPAEAGDRYQLSGEIARGGMGAVLRGRDVDLGRDLAIKVLLEKYVDRPEVARRFIEEAQIGGQLQHPGVVPVYDVGRFGDRPFFTMKLVKGHTLAALLGERTDPATDRPRLLGIALQVAQALAYAHAKGVIHRDLKPANVMVGAFGEVQVMDWGLAKVLAEGGIADEEQASRAHLREDVSSIRTARSTGTLGNFGTDTEAGSFLGTPAYVPPEQANGDVAMLDRRADVFGLGAILCEILTGKPPYLGRSHEEVRRKAANGDLADATARLNACGADQELVALTKQCLAAEAIDRPRDAQGVADGLSVYLNGVQERLQTAQRERAVAVAREAEQRKRRKVQLALAVAVIGLLLGTGTFAFWRNEQAQLVRQREARNAEAVAALLGQAEDALQADNAAKAKVALDAATKRATEGGAEKQAERLRQLEADLVVLTDLDAVDQFRWTIVDGKFPDALAVVQRLRGALGQFGIDFDAAQQDKVAARVSASVARERIVSALDRLLRQEKTVVVRALLRRVDPNPYRDAVRDAVMADAGAKLAELAGQKAALEQPPGFTTFLGESKAISVERRRELLQAAVSQRPGNLSLLMTLAGTYGLRQKDFVDERLRWYQAAAAAAPDNSTACNNLGCVLCDFRRDYDGAIVCFQRAIELNPQDGSYHYNLANALGGKGRNDEAIACFRQAIALDPKQATVHVNLGHTLVRTGQLDEARASFEKAITLDPNLPQAHTGLGGFLCDVRQDFDGAIACFRQSLALEPDNAHSLYNLGKALHAKGQVDEAIACARKAIALDPDLYQAHHLLGMELRQKGQLDEAIACFRKAVALNPRSALNFESLARTLELKGQMDEAIDAFQKSLELKPKPEAFASLGYLLNTKGQTEEAIAACQKGIALFPKHAESYAVLAIALEAKGQLDDAIATYQKAIDLDPTYASAYYHLGIVLCDHKRDYDGAIACFHKALALNAKDSRSHSNLGIALWRKGQVDEAIASFQKAIAIDPKQANSHRGLGHALFDKRAVDAAIASWRKAVELDPKDVETLGNLGSVLAQKGQMNEAIVAWRKAVELSPNDAKMQGHLGTALAAQGQLDEAIACLRQASALDPKNAVVHNNLGAMLASKGQLDDAIACWRKAVEHDPKSRDAYVNLGSALLMQGRLDEAITNYRQLSAIAPRDANAQASLASALDGKGQVDEAITCYRKAIELNPKHFAAFGNLGFTLDKAGKPGEAIDAWRQSVALRPAQPNVWYWIARAEAKRERHEEATLAFKKVRELYPPDSPRAQEAQRYLLAQRLPALLQGEAQPADNSERLAFARIAHDQKHFAFATRLWAEALAHDPKVGDDRQKQYRYDAARSAAQAAQAEVDNAAKALLRGQALGWLQAELATWSNLLAAEPANTRPTIVKTLSHWQKDPDLAGLRDQEALAKLPADEQKAFAQLWAEVVVLLKKADGPQESKQ